MAALARGFLTPRDLDAFVQQEHRGNRAAAARAKAGMKGVQNQMGMGMGGGAARDRGAPSYEDWLRETTTQSVDTEVDLQLGQFTLKKHAMQTLEDACYGFDDFVSIFGGGWSSENRMQCAEVCNSSHRMWVRLVGRRHDIQWWDADTRKPPNAHHSRPLDMLLPNERWVRDVLRPTLRAHLSDLRLFLPLANVGGAGMVSLVGMLADRRASMAAPPTMKEVLVFRDPPVVHVYNVVESGRRFFRSMCYSSDPAFAFHDMPPLQLYLPLQRCGCLI